MGDAVTGNELAEKFRRAAGRPIVYQRFPDSQLEQNDLLCSIIKLLDEGRLTGHADLASRREEFSGLLTMDAWLAAAGKPAVLAAIEAGGYEVALR